MACYECKWPNLQRTREGEMACPRCGTKAPYSAKNRPKTESSVPKVAAVYTLVLSIFALVLPFFFPMIVEISLANP